jgi:hypothetical protein
VSAPLPRSQLTRDCKLHSQAKERAPIPFDDNFMMWCFKVGTAQRCQGLLGGGRPKRSVAPPHPRGSSPGGRAAPPVTRFLFSLQGRCIGCKQTTSYPPACASSTRQRSCGGVPGDYARRITPAAVPLSSLTASYPLPSSPKPPAPQVVECDNPEHTREEWDACPFAHVGEVVTRRAPQTHLPKLCPKARRACRKGRGCPYAHNVFELWLHPSRFKTEICQHGGR